MLHSKKFFIVFLLVVTMTCIIQGFVIHHGTKLSSYSPIRKKIACTSDEQKGGKEEPDMKTYFLGNDGEFKSDMRKAGIDIKRFISFNLLALLLALGANFVGITSNLMTSTNPVFFQTLKLDQLYPIDGYFRFVENSDGYEFQYPSNWLADQTVTLANARERELPTAIREKRQAGKVRPNAAFGPMNSDGRDNVSLIKSSVMPGFSLASTLGAPKEAAERLLANVIAAPGSGKTATLIDAYAQDRDGQPSYVFEYTIQKEPAFYQHSISVIMSRGTTLFTLTAVSPESKWSTQEKIVKTIANSFRLNRSTLLDATARVSY